MRTLSLGSLGWAVTFVVGRMGLVRFLGFWCASNIRAAPALGSGGHASAAAQLEDARASVRILDALGNVANAGLLQVRVEEGFGTVCGLNDGAANVACRLAGYDYGVVGSAPCSSYGGSSVCGARRPTPPRG